MVGFILPANGQATPEEIKRRRAYAEALLQESSSGEPIQHWAQGLNKLAQGVVGGMSLKRAEDQEKQGRAQGMDVLARVLSGGGVPAAPPQQQPSMEATTAQSFQAPAPTDVLPAIQSASSKYGVDPAVMQRIAQIESGGNPNAKNPNSSASGLFQFTRGTAQQYGLKDPFNPDQSADAAARLLTDNRKQLAQVLGREPTGGELYLAHQQGAGGASKLLSNPQALASQLVGEDAVRLNGGDPGMTAADFASKWTNKFGGGGSQGAAPQQMAQAQPPAGANPALLQELLSNQFIDPAAKAIALQKLVPDPVKPVEVNGRLVNPQTGQVMADFSDPKTATVGDALIDTRTGKPLYQAQPKQTNDIQEYSFAKAQGYPGTLADYQKEMKAASRATTTVNVGGEGGADATLRKKLSEDEGKRWSDLQQAGVVSGGLQQDLSVLDELIKVAPQGPVVGRLAEQFPGVSSSGAAFNAVVKRVAPSLRTPGSGSTSDVEYQGFLDAVPKLSNKPEANMAIAETMKAKAAINVERAEVISAYQNQQIDANDARRRLEDLNKRSILTPRAKQLLGELGGGSQNNDGWQDAGNGIRIREVR